MISKKNITGIICLIAAISVLTPARVLAADAQAIFGSDFYEKENGEEFPVGIYVNGDSEIGFYRVQISYDPQRLEYIEGGSSGGDGTVIFEGNGNSQSESTLLRFRALSGGDTQITVSEAQARVSGTDGENFTMTELAAVPVKISGEDTVTPPTTSSEITEESASDESRQQDPSESGTTESASEEGRIGGNNSFIGMAIGIVAGLAGLLAAILITLGIRRNNRKKRSERIERAKATSQKLRAENNKASNNSDSVKEKTEKTEAQNIKNGDNRTEAVMPGDNKAEAAKTGDENTEAAKTGDENTEAAKTGDENTEAAKAGYDKTENSKTDIVKAEKTGSEKGTNEKSGGNDGKSTLIPAGKNTDKNADKGEPVIDVKNVTMEFKVSNTATSGLKDYAIQKVKGKLKYRKLKALDNVSFQVFKGEVVGIIGSNGSGKSTLLKIVSGAMRPTSGEVIADKNKIQLLTFGAGFDGELSAKENVYLNGAIIGYDKAFIDEHYDEIVEFSELKDFMDEKVKNFSSGMVSRLAFSIATVGGAAEILILDEVLAVGDQFFKEKSLKRVQEMIHGGSTVLIVSHSLHTIRTHCTKVVWIEKGVLKMVGEPRVVCQEYSRSHEAEDYKSLSEKNIVQDGDRIVYMKDGAVDESYNGLARGLGGRILFFRNGVFDNTFSDELAFLPETNNWYYIKEGEADTGFSGFKKKTDGRWCYIRNGCMNRSYTGLARTTKGNWYYVENGELDRSFTGLAQGPSGAWYYVNKGIYDTTYTGAAKTKSGNWYYVENGKYDNTFNGTITYEGMEVEVIDGKVQM